jgi:hypothetical protein
MSATVCDDVADLLDRGPDDLTPDEAARRAAHLDACAACRDRADAHAIAGGALRAAADGPPARFGVREHLLGAFEALAEAPEEKPAPARPAPTLRQATPAVRVRLRCTYCLAPLQTDAAVYCADCLAPVHGVCFEEHGRCAAPGCGGTRMVEPRAPRRRRTATGRAVVLASALALVTGVAAWSSLTLEPAAVVDARATTEAPPPPVEPEVAPPTPVSTPAAPAAPTAPPLRVLYVESHPRWEYRYLKNLLLRDPSLRVQVLLLSADPGFVQEHSPDVPALETFPSPEGLESYDVVILGDVARADLYAGAFVTVARAVADGAGLLVIDGQQSGAAWGQTALRTVLPVQHDPGAPLTDDSTPWQPALTAAGRASSLLWLDTGRPEDEALWSPATPLEPLYGYTRALSAGGGAQVLLVHPTDRGPLGPRPLLAWKEYGSGRCAWLGFDESWRWRAGVGDRLMTKFYGGLLRLLARTEARPARPSDCTVRLRSGVEVEAALQSIRAVQGTLTISASDGRAWALRDVAEVVFVPGEPAAPTRAVLLASGDLLAGVVRQGDELEFMLGSPTLGDVRIPLNQTRVVALGDLGRRSLLAPSSWDDAGERLFLKDGTARVADVLKIDEMLARYSTSAGQDVVALSALDWVSLTPFPAAPVRAPAVTLRLVDGSRLRATLLELNWGAVRLEHPVLDRVTVAREAVLSLRLD